MPTTTEPTQRTTGARTDSIHESQITSRIPSRPSGVIRDPSLAVSGERPGGRLRPVSVDSSHETVTPDRQKVNPVDPAKRMSSAEITTAMVHFYRGEIQRSNTWRNRLDTTTNWAVLTAGGALSFAFSSPNNPHFIIPIISILVAIFLLMEARRYRYYEIWASRVRVLETGYYAPMLAPDNVPRDQEWASHLANDLLTPHFTISVWEAIGRRLRRNYIWLFALLALSWNLKVYLHPLPARNFDEFLLRAQVGLVPGWTRFRHRFPFQRRFVYWRGRNRKTPGSDRRSLAASRVFAAPIATHDAVGRARPRQSRKPPCGAPSARASACAAAPPASTKRSILRNTPDRRIHVSETPDRPKSKQ